MQAGTLALRPTDGLLRHPLRLGKTVSRGLRDSWFSFTKSAVGQLVVLRLSIDYPAGMVNSLSGLMKDAADSRFLQENRALLLRSIKMKVAAKFQVMKSADPYPYRFFNPQITQIFANYFVFHFFICGNLRNLRIKGVV